MSVFRNRLQADVPAQATAGTAQAAIVGEAPVAGVVVAASIIPAAAVAANATNFRVFTLFNRGATGVGTTSVATLTTATVSLVDNDEAAMTLSGTPANLALVANDVLEVAESVGGTGVAHGGYEITVEYTRS